MSVLARVRARPSTVGSLYRLAAADQATAVRGISWMAFEMPNPTIYQNCPSVQPKRPVIADSVTTTDSTSPPAQPVTEDWQASSIPPAIAKRSQASVSSKVVPAPVRASAIRSGPAPLSQIQKRSLSKLHPYPEPSREEQEAAAAKLREKRKQEAEAQDQQKSQKDTTNNKSNVKSPTMTITIPGHQCPKVEKGTLQEDILASILTIGSMENPFGLPNLKLRLPGHPATQDEKPTWYPRSRWADEDKEDGKLPYPPFEPF
ncbi:hypothetical protein F4808DRAFT_427602 [Astrocystis sublimbata]|nr:hypothetical protein F4808DRAFT_427602 [Astrocystis sublimbata]